MTPEQIEEMKRDREAGSPGPWIWETESGEWPDHSLVAGDGEAVLYWDFDCGFRFNSRKDANRLTRVPDMEAHILALTAENARLRVEAEAAEAQLAEVKSERDRLLRAAQHVQDLPPGEWETWTSCSFRRITARCGPDGGVLHATFQRSDGHPDLSWSEETCRALCDLVNGLRAALKDAQDGRGQPRPDPATLARIQGTPDPWGYSRALADVLAERARQISEEGWTAEHDDQHIRGELASAAACYASPLRAHEVAVWAFWPSTWDRSYWKPSAIPGDMSLRRRDLVKAGALILAEIERLDRAQEGRGKGNHP